MNVQRFKPHVAGFQQHRRSRIGLARFQKHITKIERGYQQQRRSRRRHGTHLFHIPRQEQRAQRQYRNDYK